MPESTKPQQEKIYLTHHMFSSVTSQHEVKHGEGQRNSTACFTLNELLNNHKQFVKHFVPVVFPDKNNANDSISSKTGTSSTSIEDTTATDPLSTDDSNNTANENEKYNQHSKRKNSITPIPEHEKAIPSQISVSLQLFYERSNDAKRKYLHKDIVHWHSILDSQHEDVNDINTWQRLVLSFISEDKETTYEYEISPENNALYLFLRASLACNEFNFELTNTGKSRAEGQGHYQFNQAWLFPHTEHGRPEYRSQLTAEYRSELNHKLRSDLNFDPSTYQRLVKDTFSLRPKDAMMLLGGDQLMYAGFELAGSDSLVGLIFYIALLLVRSWSLHRRNSSQNIFWDFASYLARFQFFVDLYEKDEFRVGMLSFLAISLSATFTGIYSSKLIPLSSLVHLTNPTIGLLAYATIIGAAQAFVAGFVIRKLVEHLLNKQSEVTAEDAQAIQNFWPEYDNHSPQVNKLMLCTFISGFLATLIVHSKYMHGGHSLFYHYSIDLVVATVVLAGLATLASMKYTSFQKYIPKPINQFAENPKTTVGWLYKSLKSSAQNAFSCHRQVPAAEGLPATESPPAAEGLADNNSDHPKNRPRK